MAGIRRYEIASGWRLNWSDYEAGWTVSWTETGPSAEAFSQPGFDDSGWLDARVPGDVHFDLMRAGEIPDPFIGANTDLVMWMEQKDWWYRTCFDVPVDWQQDESGVFRLLFHGLDCFAVVYLNGVEVGRHANMFTPLEVDVSDALDRQGPNLLAVRLASPLFAPMEPASRAPAWWGHPRQLARKAQMSYGWDIAPRLVTIGIWKPVELLLITSARLGEPWVRTSSLNVNEGTAAMQAAIPVEIVVEGEDVSVELEVEGEEIGRADLPSASGWQEAFFGWNIEDARFWWPQGSGAPHLYEYRVKVLSGGSVVDERSGRFGIRKIELDRSPTDDGGHAFSFSVNGRKVFMKGWNWTPPDALFTRVTPERRRELLAIAHDSGANMIRVWGGGVYEPKDFYEECDRLGLLVWQDFMFSCSQYPQDGKFLDEVREEAAHVIKVLRSHPCLALWCGDNECDMCYPNLREAMKNRINRQILPDAVEKLDPDTPYVSSSPDSPAGRMWDDRNDSDAHLWRHGECYTHPSFVQVRPKFVSEIGFLSLPGAEVVRKMFGGENPPWPPEGDIWKFHSADCIRSQRFRGMEHLLKDIESCGRQQPETLEEAVEVTQELQAEAYRLWVETFSSREECGGILLWNLCDCWPQMSDAVIAWPLEPKKAFFAVREAFAAIDDKAP